MAPGLFPEWQAAHADDQPALPERVRLMYGAHGRGPEGVTCKWCAHLIRMVYAKTYLKCELGPLSHGAATDWRASWPACGKYEDGEGKRKKVHPRH